MSPPDANPYASPVAEPSPEEGFRSDFRTTAWQVILAWEKLRLVYLAWLSVVGLGTLYLESWDWPDIRLDFEVGRFLLIVAVGFVGANACFTAGHVLELFTALLGMPRPARVWLRTVVFTLGTLLATLLTMGFVIEGLGL